jgi:hypothetical protein
MACQTDSDCTLLHLQSLNCFAACGQLVGNADSSALTAAATQVCDAYFAAGCPEIRLTCPFRSGTCDRGRCGDAVPGTDAAAGGGSGGSGGAGGPRSDARGCTCGDGTLTWDCYCSAFDCNPTLGSYADLNLTSGLAGYEEFAGCNLAIVHIKEMMGPWVRHVFDLTSGRLVGDETGSDVGFSCPFALDSLGYSKLGAGVLAPDPSCVRSTCLGSPGLSGTCGSGGSGGSGGTSGAGGASTGGTSGAGGTGDAGIDAPPFDGPTFRSTLDTAVASICPACGADELCVATYDGTCRPMSTFCRKVSAETRDRILVKHESCFMKPLGDEVCGNRDVGVFWGCGGPPCIDEPLLSDINRYGP